VGLIWVGRGRDRVGMGDSEELTHMLAAVAEGIAVGPGCSSLGWPFCRDVLGGYVCNWCWTLVPLSSRLRVRFCPGNN
jgi:hypothetical protein